MTCAPCELIRARAIAMAMGGLRKSAKQITEALVGRYGSMYYQAGNKVMRKVPTGDELIYEARR
jgi:hypothetical protein